MIHSAKASYARRTTRRLGVFAMLSMLDRSYRHRQSLKNLTDAQLKDVGLSRQDVDQEIETAPWNAPNWMRRPF